MQAISLGTTGFTKCPRTVDLLWDQLLVQNKPGHLHLHRGYWNRYTMTMIHFLIWMDDVDTYRFVSL